jgi:hypothetical protein
MEKPTTTTTTTMMVAMMMMMMMMMMMQTNAREVSLGDEASVEEVEDRVLDASDVEVHGPESVLSDEGSRDDSTMNASRHNHQQQPTNWRSPWWPSGRERPSAKG